MAEDVRKVALILSAQNKAAGEIAAFEKGIGRVRETVQKLSTDTERMAGIASQFKLAGFDSGSIDKIKSQFETVGDLQDRHFAATHSDLEIALKKHEDYFSSLRIKWQENESILTLINQTETAERKKIFKDYSDSTMGSLGKWKSILRLGAFTYITKSFIDTGTAMLEAKRKGESMFDAFLSGIPIVNRLAESADKLAGELSGLNAALEASGSSRSLAEKYEKIGTELYRSIELQKAGEDGSVLQRKFAYEDRLKEINALEKEVEAIKDYNKSLDEQIKKLEESAVTRAWSRRGQWQTGEEQKDIKKQIEDLKNQKLLIPNLDILREQAKTEYNIGTDGGSALTKEQIKALQDAAEKRTQITARMYDDLEKYDIGYRNAQIELLNLQKTDYGQFIEDKILLDQWYQAQREKLELDIVKKTDPLKAYFMELERDMSDTHRYISEQLADVAVDTNATLKDSFKTAITEGGKLRDFMANVFRGIGDSFADMAAQMAADAMTLAIVQPLLNSFFGGLNLFGNAGGTITASPSALKPGQVNETTGMGWHGGGIVGYDQPTFRRVVSSVVFDNAPRLHQGLRSDEVPAILQKGEQVIPKNQAMQGGGVYIENLTIKAWDTQDVKRGLYKERNFLSDLSLMSKKGNHPNRRYEK